MSKDNALNCYGLDCEPASKSQVKRIKAQNPNCTGRCLKLEQQLAELAALIDDLSPYTGASRPIGLVNMDDYSRLCELAHKYNDD